MNIIDKIQNNPYRALGVYVGGPVSLELRNKNKIVAYFRVGQQTSFSFPIEEELDGIDRTEVVAEKALQILALPYDRLCNALFWIGDGESAWSSELNNAIDALLEGKLLNAICHYGNIFYNQSLRNDFQQAVTHGLLNLSSDELTKVLCSNLVNDEAELVSAFTQADISVKPNQIIRQLCDQTIILNFEKTISFDDVICYITVNDKVEIDFYSSFGRLATKIKELLPLIKVVGSVYGEDSSKYEQFVEQIIHEIYWKATFIVEAIGEWVWVYNKKTMRNGERCRLISVRTKQCVDSCMQLISEIDDCVAHSIDRLRPSQNSIRILLPVRYKYELALNREHITDKSQIIKSVNGYKRSRMVSDIIWLAILGLIFFLV